MNRRYTAAITSIGGHHATGVSLAGYMNLPPPVESTGYQGHLSAITHSAQQSALSSCRIAAQEAKEAMKSTNIRVSVDGTWQRRGFSSKNGVVTVLSVMGKDKGSKVLDTEVLSTYCHTCTQRNCNENTKLANIVSQHECSINHQGSAGKMEADGAVAIFSRSKDRNNVKYAEFLGDGDSKAYSTVKERCNPDLVKLECTGHIQKRMGKALMNCVTDHKSQKFVVDGNRNWLKGKKVANRSRGEKLYTGIGGVGRLTTKAIKSIQGHYGAAIRGNSTLADMKEAIWNIYNHRDGNHNTCPSWCASHDNDMEKANKHRLPRFVFQIIKPIFERLSSDDLLSKCLHGGTQNNNEAFHHTLWARCPKEKFAGQTRIVLAAAIATLVFNDGERALLPAFAEMDITPGIYHQRYASEADERRVSGANKAALTKTKSVRQQRQHTNSTDQYYNPGNF